MSRRQRIVCPIRWSVEREPTRLSSSWLDICTCAKTHRLTQLILICGARSDNEVISRKCGDVMRRVPAARFLPAAPIHWRNIFVALTLHAGTDSCSTFRSGGLCRTIPSCAVLPACIHARAALLSASVCLCIRLYFLQAAYQMPFRQDGFHIELSCHETTHVHTSLESMPTRCVLDTNAAVSTRASQMAFRVLKCSMCLAHELKAPDQRVRVALHFRRQIGSRGEWTAPHINVHQ